MKRLLTVVATTAATLLGATSLAHADEAVSPRVEPAAAATCGYTDTMYVNSQYDQAGLTCRYRSGLGTLTNYTSTADMPNTELYHHLRFENFSGRSIHLGFYRQGKRNGTWYTTTLADNAYIARGDDRVIAREYGRYVYQQVRGVVKHHGTDRSIYTPSIYFEQCTGPGGQC